MKIKVYGCRGSVPMSRSLRSRYGGNTSCTTLTSNGQTIIFDAGSGILRMECDLKERYPKYPKEIPFSPTILLSHLHLDHVIGLAAFQAAYDADAGTKVFTCSRDEKPLISQVLGAFVPPYWPLSMETIAKIKCVEIHHEVTFYEGRFAITPFYTCHPDNTMSFHVKDGDKTVVHLLDSEVALMGKTQYAELVEHCRNADLVIFDASYTIDDYNSKIGWGHSSVVHGVKLAQESGCKRMLFSHFSPEYNDRELDELIAYLIPYGYGSRFILASDGLELDI